jgi:hypothetical protein
MFLSSRQSKARWLQGALIRSRALAAGAIRGSRAAARIDVCGGQHSQQGRAAAGTTRVSSAAHSRDGPSPLKPFMQRCVFLRFRFVHRKKPPRVETRPKQQVHAPPFHWADRNPNSARHGRPWLRRQHNPPEIRPSFRQINSRSGRANVRPAPRKHAQVSDWKNR